jgi:biopolymer transport protein ExbD
MSFVAATRDRQGPAVPMAGMIDIMFLLLVFFMTAAVYREQEQQIDVSLPQATESTGGDRSQIVVTIKADGTIFVAGAAYNMDTFGAKLKDVASQFPDEMVVIRGDKDCPLGLAVRVMDMIYAANLRNVYLATTKPQSEVGR